MYFARLHFSVEKLSRTQPTKVHNKKPLKKSSEVSQQRYKDSNLEMTESESVALPFGDSAIFCFVCVLFLNTLMIIHTFQNNASTFFNFFYFFYKIKFHANFEFNLVTFHSYLFFLFSLDWAFFHMSYETFSQKNCSP